MIKNKTNLVLHLAPSKSYFLLSKAGTMQYFFRKKLNRFLATYTVSKATNSNTFFCHTKLAKYYRAGEKSCLHTDWSKKILQGIS